MVSGANPGARLVSVERDGQRAAAVRNMFTDRVEGPKVEVVHADWPALRSFGPFDLLVLDGGGHGKKDQPPIVPGEWLRVGSLVVIDDFTPMDRWPPEYRGRVDGVRVHWLTHPELLGCEIRVGPDAATLVATYVGPNDRSTVR
jgi:predicted O-methyltransferase YrrM